MGKKSNEWANRFPLPAGAYPEAFRMPAGDSELPRFVSLEDDLWRYANDPSKAEAHILKSWSLQDLLNAIGQFTAGGHPDHPYKEMNFRDMKEGAPIAHLYTALMARHPNRQHDQDFGTWEENVLLFLARYMYRRPLWRKWANSKESIQR